MDKNQNNFIETLPHTSNHVKHLRSVDGFSNDELIDMRYIWLICFFKYGF